LLTGAPCILRRQNGLEFCHKAVKDLKATQPQLKIMHGKPRHGQRQGIKRDHRENLNAKKYYQKLGWKL
jgi:hypothetical protein